MFLSRTFTSFDEFNSFPHGWDTDFRVNSHSAYKSHIERLQSDKLLINIADFDQPTIQQGSTPEGMRTFALPLRIGGPMTWLDQEISTNNLLLFAESRELFSLASANLQIATIAVDGKRFTEMTDELGIADRPGMSDAHSPTLTNRHRDRLHRNLYLFMEFCKKFGGQTELAEWQTYMETTLIETFLSPIAEQQSYPDGIHHSTAAKHARQATAYILANLQDPLTVGDICRELGVSRRTLETSFSRTAGCSPKRIISNLRFDRCHRQLVDTTPRYTTVTAVARGWGFWHMGQFSRDYRLRYGENPGQTLARMA